MAAALDIVERRRRTESTVSLRHQCDHRAAAGIGDDAEAAGPELCAATASRKRCIFASILASADVAT